MPQFRRGFKTEVNDLVDDVRRDFGVRPLDPLDPLALAAHLEIPVVGITSCDANLVERFLRSTLSSRFHAATVPLGTGSVIVHNDTASPARQRSNVAHELGHVLLEHNFAPVNTDEGPMRDSAVEREAAWFGFALLVTAQAALTIVRTGLDVADAATLLGVSEDAVRYRLDVSGARRRAANERKLRALSPDRDMP
jgi:hypothetical protein